MNQERLHTTNEHLMANFDDYINEYKISSAIIKLSNEIIKIESFCGPSRRTSSMRDDIAKLEVRLASCKIQGKILTR
jgi:hypothetical protein